MAAERLTPEEVEVLRVEAIERNYPAYGPRSAEHAVLRLLSTIDEMETAHRGCAAHLRDTAEAYRRLRDERERYPRMPVLAMEWRAWWRDVRGRLVDDRGVLVDDDQAVAQLRDHADRNRAE